MSRFLLLFAAVLPSVSSQYYSMGIGKTTHSCSDPDTALKWMLANLPSSQDPYGPCTSDEYCKCGVLGRVTLDTDDVVEGPKGFGLHTVAITSGPRPSGNVTVTDVEKRYTAKLKAVSPGGYDSFMDYNTGFWVSSLDPYITAFQKLGSTIWPIEWRDEVNGVDYYSLLVQVEPCMLLIELMSATKGSLPSPRYKAPHARFFFAKGQTPTSVFGVMDDGSSDKPVLHPARVSHFTSDVARDRKYYTQALQAGVLASTSTKTTTTLVTSFENLVTGAYVQVHLVQRGSSNTTGGFHVADFEDVQNVCHDANVKSDVCGWDTWMDNHYIVNNPPLTAHELASNFTAMGYKYHAMKNAGGGLSFYAITPNGISIQLNNLAYGGWSPSAALGSAAGDLCGTGTC